MKKYELMTLVLFSLGESKAKEINTKVKSEIEALSGKVLEEDFWGKRSLAYNIGTDNQGFYNVLQFEIPSKKLEKLKSKFNLIDDLERYLVTAKKAESSSQDA